MAEVVVLAGFLPLAIAMTAGVAALLRRDGPWAEALTRHAIAIGSTIEGMRLLRQAHQIFERIGAAETCDILTELDTLSGSPGA